MTNIYPFLVGKAAIHHEKIDEFPEVAEPENHALGVHCGYAGFVPGCFCQKWKMVPKVLERSSMRKAYMINGELPLGDMVLAKINPSFDKVTVIPGEIEKYVQFPGTDARNASLLHYHNGGRSYGRTSQSSSDDHLRKAGGGHPPDRQWCSAGRRKRSK